MTLFRTLYARLGASLMLILLVLAGLFLFIDLVSSRRLLQEINQDVHRDLAAHLIAESIPLEDGEVRPEALEHIFHMLMVINPAIEVYLLGTGGEVLEFSAPEGHVVRQSVALDPIRRFLEGRDESPILGDDPKSLDGHKVFSVAPIGRADSPEGYLYVILGGEQYESTAAMLQASRIMRLGIGLVVTIVLVAFAAGLFLFARITRPLRTLSQGVQRFQSSGFTRPEEIGPAGGATRSVAVRGDEVETLGATFRRMAERLTSQMEEIKKTDSLRRDLIANVSHDLRTPITSLRGYLETLMVKSDRLSESEKREYVETALRHSERLGDLVSDLFELAKLDSMTIELEIEQVAIAELLQDMAQDFRLRSREKEVDLQTDIEPDRAFFVDTDVGLISRVMANLLDNAIRHTPAGGVVTIRMLEADTGYRVEVEDTGPGIRGEDLPQVFDRFYRTRRSSSSRNDGAGLGLAIAKQALHLLGSTLDVETSRVPGSSGTTFFFVLDAARAGGRGSGDEKDL